jgi:kumamolisin
LHRRSLHYRQAYLVIIAILGVIVVGCGSESAQPGSGPWHQGGTSKPPSGANALSDPLAILIASSTDLGLDGRGSISLDLGFRSGWPARESSLLNRMYAPPHLARSGGRASTPFLTGEGAVSLGPAIGQVLVVKRLLRRLGVAASWSAGANWVTATGPVRVIDRVFHVAVRRYRAPGLGGSRGVLYLASATDPSVPAALRPAISGAGRICTYTWIHATVAPTGGFSPAGILDAYDVAQLRAHGIDGAGQTVVFPEIDGVDRGAIADYAHLYHLPPFKLTIHGPTLKAGAEATMDVEVVHAIAPRARLVVYDFNGHVTNGGWTQESLRMINGSAGDVISSSVGGCDGTYNSTDAADFASAIDRADLMGESMFASSGDNGAFDCIQHGDTPGTGVLGVDMPAALPGVTAVGGTRLTVGANGAWHSETAWEGPIETAGGGGGVSRFFRQPPWQSAPGVSAAGALNPGRMRMVPDVSADADPVSGATIIFPEGVGQGGGTSQAAPIWAGITALIDQNLERTGHHKIGWMNPALYYLARTHPTFAPFHDVTVGTNLFYPATRGYDMATGLGTPDAWNLARDLVRYQAARGR